MITAKRLWLAATLVLSSVTLAVVAAYLLVSDEALVAWIATRTESATGVSICYQTPVKLSRTLSPTLTVTDLVVTDTQSGYRLRTSSVEMQVSLPRLLLGQLDIPRLWLGDTRIESSGAATPATAASAAYKAVTLPLKPAFRDVKIAQLSIVRTEGEMRLPALDVDELSLSLEPDTSVLVLHGQLHLAGEAIDLKASVPDLRDGLNAQKIGFSVSAQSPGASLGATGHVDFAKPEVVLDGSLSAQAADLKRISTGIKGLSAPGSLAAQARFEGSVAQLGLRDIRVQWQGPEQSSLMIQGGIDDLDDLAGVALDVSGRLDDAAWLAPVLPDTLGALKQAAVSARLSGDPRQLNVREFSLSAIDANRLHLSMRGQFDLAVSGDSAKANNLGVLLAFDAPATRAARALLFEGIPEFGAVQGKLDIRSESGDPSLENIVVSARDPKGIEVDLSGRIGRFPLDPAQSNRGYDLDVRMKARQVSLLGERLGLELSQAGPADLKYRIEGDSQALRLEQIKLTAGNKNALRLSAAGQVHFRDWDQADPLEMINLDLQANSRDTKSLAKLLGTELPELGALDAKARLQTVANRHQITDFQLQTAKRAPVTVSLSGTAAHVVLLPAPAVEDMALSASASTADVARLNALFGWQAAMPAIGPAQASARISGSNRKLSVSDVSITAGEPDILLIKANGRLGTLSIGNAWRPKGTDLTIKAGATGSKALTELLGYRVPELGPLAASAKIRDKAKTLALHSGRIRVGDAWSPVVQAEGYVSDLLGVARTGWDVTLDLDAHQFAQFAENKQISELGALHGKLQISNSDGSLGIDRLSINSRGSKLLSMAINGQYGDFGRLDTLSLNGVVNARDLEIVGALLGRDWPAIGPFSIETRVSRVVNNLAFDTLITAGKSEVHADLVATLEAEPLLVSGKIVARDAFVPVLVRRATQDVAKKPVSTGPVFSRERISFDWMHKFDLDLVVDVESFDPELSRAQSARANIAMSSGQLWVRPVTINYPVGQLTLDMQLDARQRPRLSVKAFGEHLDPWRALYMEEGRKDLKGNLDVNIDLALSGHSAHELAASANGGVYLQLRNGAIRSDLMDLLFVDLVGWVRSKAAREQYDHFSCGVADYSIAHGVVSTKAFILDGEQITISGEGSIDLGPEQLDYVFLPRKKSRFFAKADPVEITGSLSGPKVSVIPWKSAVATYGTLWFAPYVFVGATAVDYLAGQLRGKGKKSPCLEYQETFARPVHHSTAQ